MTTLLGSSSSSIVSDSIPSDSYSDGPILDDADLEIDEYNYSVEETEQEMIMITGNPWGADEESVAVPIILDEDMNHISLESKSRARPKGNIEHFNDQVAIREKTDSQKAVEMCSELCLKPMSPPDQPFYPRSCMLNQSNGQTIHDAVDNYFGVLPLSKISDVASETEVSRELCQKKEHSNGSKGKGKRQATSDIEIETDDEKVSPACQRGGAHTVIRLLGWKARDEAKLDGKRKITIDPRRKAAPKAFRYNTIKFPSFSWQKLVDLPILADSRDTSAWPSWLHPAFCIESNDHMERLNVKALNHLLRSILESERSYVAFRNIFESIYGPIVCHGRVEEMYETIRAIGVVYRYDDLAVQYCDPTLASQAPSPEVVSGDDHFTRRFLGSFSSFAAFQQHDEVLKETTPEMVYSALSTRMLNWYRGNGEVDDYQLWGLARILMLEEMEERFLHPDDLTSSDRREWQHRLEACTKYEDALTVTEEYFGPLSPIDQYETPKIELDKIWSPCQCSICNRSRKRIKTEK